MTDQIRFIKSSIATTFVVVSLLTISGCLAPSQTAQQAAVSLPNSWFQGVGSVVNLGGYPVSIQISWTPSNLAKGYHVYMASQSSSGSSTQSWVLVSSLNSPTSAVFIHNDPSLLNLGGLYTYMVKALDSTGTEDPNEVQLSTVAFQGVTQVTITSQTTANININPSGSFSEVVVIAHPVRKAASDTTADIKVDASPPQAVVPLTGLWPGTTYQFSAQVVVGNNGTTDGNQLSITQSTSSNSFGSGLSTEGVSVYDYRNVRLVQAYGSAPNEINTHTMGSNVPTTMTRIVNPDIPMVKIIPNPFGGSLSGKFRVVRAAGVGLTGTEAPTTIDTTATAACTSTTDTSCVVCDHNTSSQVVTNGDCDLTISTTPPTFIDQSVAAPPKKYFYTITFVNTFNSILWPEELPSQNTSDFMIGVHIPDANMVLVHRDSANYEMCTLLGQASDPRHFNRCPYTGIASTPYSTNGVSYGLPSGYYDFGYNLFVDRHGLACNWTRPSAGTPAPCGSANGCINLAVTQPLPATGGSSFVAETTINTIPTSSGAPNPPAMSAANAALSPMVLFNLQAGGANCYVDYLNITLPNATDPAAANPNTTTWVPVGALAATSAQLAAAPVTSDQISSILSTAVTADPGPLGAIYSNRKRPVISGLTGQQAQALCNTQSSSAYGTKRLMRRREYIAASAFSTFPGEPGFTSPLAKSALLSGSNGQTLYNWSTGAQIYGNGTNAGLGLNPGGCAAGPILGQLSASPLYCNSLASPSGCPVATNTTVSSLSKEFCSPSSPYYTSGKCVYPTLNNGGFTSGGATGGDGTVYSSFPSSYLNVFLDPKNENAQIGTNGLTPGNGFSNRYFIGSLATNQCVSRFGLQDPSPSGPFAAGSSFTSNEASAMGIFFTDAFQQNSTLTKSTNPPIYQPVSNSVDYGVYYDYTYNNGSTTILFANDNSGYTATGYNGSSTLTCSDNVVGYSQSYFTNNYYYLSSGFNALATAPACSSSGARTFATLAWQPQRNQTVFTGYLPILGLPLTQYATALNSTQQQVNFSSFLFGNEFASSSSNLQAYGRFYSVSTSPVTVYMSSGYGSRWSFEISESNGLNSGGLAWCAVEAP